MGILFFTCIIMAIVIYCLLKPSNKTPIKELTKPTNISTIPTKSTPPTIPTNNKKKLIGPFSKTWTLTEFSREFGSMQYSDKQVNPDTREIFTSCRFIDSIGNITYVNFHKSLGVLTKEEIIRRQKELKVGQSLTGKYFFYTGEAGKIEDVNLKI